MPATYQEYLQQIAELKEEAERVRQEEFAGVIARIKEAIAAYDLTPEDLFGERRQRAASAAGAKTVRRTSKKAATQVRYRDNAGNAWGGRGPRPQWLRDELAKGKRLQDFAV